MPSSLSQGSSKLEVSRKAGEPCPNLALGTCASIKRRKPGSIKTQLYPKASLVNRLNRPTVRTCAAHLHRHLVMTLTLQVKLITSTKDLRCNIRTKEQRRTREVLSGKENRRKERKEVGAEEKKIVLQVSVVKQKVLQGLYILQFRPREPLVMFSAIPAPTDKILKTNAATTSIQYAFNEVFVMPINGNRRRLLMHLRGEKFGVIGNERA
ncbi:hypothetical protein K474DRAFT_1674606 [Panus rudis PR-1116 ss-1]|nr:hypothetical protein K474DRAFT_1674606 [Panus rudis PR-1116 ss-1]